MLSKNICEVREDEIKQKDEKESEEEFIKSFSGNCNHNKHNGGC